MWFLQPKDDYVSQMPWKHADEPAVMSWQIRARDYNTFVANILFAILMVVLSVMSIWFGFAWGFESTLTSILMAGGVMLFSLLMAMSMTHQTTIIVYRFTETGAEVRSWKPQIDSVKPVLKWLSIILFPIVGVIILMDPGLVVTAIGPLGIGLMAWMMGSSKEYQAWQRNSQHHELDWQKADKVYIYRGRSIIGLNIPWYNPQTEKYVAESIDPIFCHKEEFNERIEYFRQRLPKVVFVEEKFEVFH